MPAGVPVERFQPEYDDEVERLCAYIKNDSLVRWSTGCSQADVDAARAHLAKRRKFFQGTGAIPKRHYNDEEAELRQRVRRAKRGNDAFLKAIARAAQ